MERTICFYDPNEYVIFTKWLHEQGGVITFVRQNQTGDIRVNYKQ
ncbi:hypothetical protein [Halobacillus naozhouensis]|uniref:Uncharacterized protein n=1 Tax=Halobacillus naozhouensis TaxID=554880 RepID=A0ABY8IXC4_9BACI|nr:hypothetical protein [Halobacillus naozhouensis]WFT74897.1 hypothetical protein P9989_00205 [Halobacillus naozhouensis]